MLTSPKNPAIQRVRKLQTQPRARREAGLFVIEGARLLEECRAAGVRPETLLYTEPGDPALLAGFRALGVVPTPVSQPAMQAASDTKTPQGLLAVVPIPKAALPASPDLILVLAGIRDPGNLGTILRTAAAAGADAVLVAPGSADPFQPKAVRGGMGAHFRIPIRTPDWDEIAGICAPLNVFLADAAGEALYTRADMRSPCALIVGGEAHGAAPETTRLSPIPLRIPMPGGSESLNAAVAAGILLFEAVRQRELSPNT